MELKNLLERVLGSHEGVPQLKIFSLKESSCTKPGQNFMSVVSLVHVEGEFPDGALYSKRVFVKRPTHPAHHGQPFSVDDAFANEVLMYQDVLPMITAAADVTKVPCPLYYHAAGDVIVLEDLRAQGYGVGDVAGGFGLATARCIIKALAKFHAASYHTSVVENNRFSETIRDLKPLGLMVSSNRRMMETSLKRAIRYLETEDDLKTAATSLRKLQGSVTEKMRELRHPKYVTVLVHGDFWFNNILTRRNEEESEGSGENQFRIIDFQTCAFQSPAVDFWLFLYTSIIPTLLADHGDSFIQLYSSSFLEVLSNQNTPADRIPSVKSLEEELTSKELYGFLAAMAYLPALYLKRELISEIGNASEEEKEEEGYLERFVGPEFRERLIEVARYCSKKGVL